MKTLNEISWACRRGMLELDLVLGSFLCNCYSELEHGEQKKFHHLLTHHDHDLYRWLVMGEKVDDPLLVGFVDKLIVQ